jgi:hypothetical protein
MFHGHVETKRCHDAKTAKTDWRTSVACLMSRLIITARFDGFRGLQFCKVIVLDNHLSSSQHVKAPQMC